MPDVSPNENWQPKVELPHPTDRELYQEVKNYIKDLMTNEWVRRSNSAYASPIIVCDRRKDGSLRLCTENYTKL